MKKILMGTIIVLGLSGQAFAADLGAGTYAKAPVVAPVYDWSGFYIGGNVGYGWGDRNVTSSPNDSLSGLLGAGSPTSFSTSGVFGGFQAGYNRQFNSNILLGLETDFNFSDIQGSGSSSSQVLGQEQFGPATNEHVKWFGTVRGRLGYVAAPDLLIYGTGGLAYGQVEQIAGYRNNGTAPLTVLGPPSVSCPALSNCYVGSSSNVATGWTAGGGFEYAIWSHWTAKVEYQYVNLGENSFQQGAIIFSGSQSTINTHYSDTAFHTVRAGINYHF